MATTHLLDGEGAVRCGASPRPDGANVTSDRDLVTCAEGCLAVYPPPLGYMLPLDMAIRLLKAAQPRDVVLQFPIGSSGLVTVLDYRPAQGPLPEGPLPEPRTTCSGCFEKVRPNHHTDHARGCPTGQNGTPNYE